MAAGKLWHSHGRFLPPYVRPLLTNEAVRYSKRPFNVFLPLFDFYSARAGTLRLHASNRWPDWVSGAHRKWQKQSTAAAFDLHL